MLRSTQTFSGIFEGIAKLFYLEFLRFLLRSFTEFSPGIRGRPCDARRKDDLPQRFEEGFADGK